MIRHRRYSSFLCLTALVFASFTACKDEKPHVGRMPHADPGRIILVAGTGFTGMDEHAELPNVQVPVPTGIAAYRDGSLLALVNGDGGTVLRLTPGGQAEPFEYYRTQGKSSDKDINFDASRSPQKGWLGQQNSSSIIRASNGDLWIYANRWIATITADERAVVTGRLKLPEYTEDFDYQTRIFNGLNGDVLVARRGKLYKIGSELEIKPYSLPKDITKVTAATTDGKDLLIGGTGEIYRVNADHITHRDQLKPKDSDAAGSVVGITADDHGGYFAATSAGLIFYAATGKAPIQLAGIGHKPEASFGGIENCPPAGHMNLVHNPLAAELGNPESMLLYGDQLFIADAGCSRIYALGVSHS
jgi:hypothetical protein